MGRVTGEQPAELIRMRRRLDEFRRGTKPGVSFPGWVWAAAARLARRYGVHRTGRALGLEYNKLKRASGGRLAAAGAGETAKRARGTSGTMKFVELRGAPPLAGNCCRVRLAGPTGEHLEFEMAAGAATEMLLGLTRAGWGGGA